MYPANLEVVVIGGSLSGLFASVVLESLDNVSKITILERYGIDQLQDLGAGIRCNTEVIHAIKEFFGIPPEQYAAFASAYRMLDQDGNVYFDQPTSGFTTSWAQLYRVFRERFDASQKCSYRHRCTLAGLHQTDKSDLLVEFLNEKGEKDHVSAHLVIGADGASSKSRSLVFPEVTREPTGYVCYRGLVNESVLSESAKDLYNKAGTFSWPLAGQFVSYLVPGNEAPADKATRMTNWVWYQNKSKNELLQLMLDKNKITHKFSLPHGSMREEEVARIHAQASTELPPLHAEVINKTSEPFVQVITDSFSSKNQFYGGKLLLVGDAVGGQRLVEFSTIKKFIDRDRPHTASAILQTAFHALLVRKLVQGGIDLSQWSKEIEEFSSILCESGKELGRTLMAYDSRPHQQRSLDYLKLFLSVQNSLNMAWKRVIGIGDAVVAM